MRTNDSFLQRAFGIGGASSDSSIGSVIEQNDSTATEGQAVKEEDVVASVIEYASTLKQEYDEKHKQLEDEVTVVKNQLVSDVTTMKNDIELAKQHHIKWLVTSVVAGGLAIAAGGWTLYSDLDTKHNNTLNLHHADTKGFTQDISTIKVTIDDIDKHDNRLKKLESELSNMKTSQAVTQTQFKAIWEGLSKTKTTQKNN
ncbi:hypothetical protein [Vibrio jasicida]|uniref:hypothetical protein n=1 Tax=Vibrio jasicida TaxID=766224 RepID=UPI00039A9E7A|nr:hypothetical protein [Vibrio jasicida]